jgi:hypothetical protein
VLYNDWPLSRRKRFPQGLNSLWPARNLHVVSPIIGSDGTDCTLLRFLRFVFIWVLAHLIYRSSAKIDKNKHAHRLNNVPMNPTALVRVRDIVIWHSSVPCRSFNEGES